ncbi:hypothetical protein B0H67DRAFT_559482 [Lasiosphaeris hirsuta]|uniref:Uncharacterized protein n=1 Tax=Lasiosphaeris hirsuta TaxID=260670 RepID=A0AA40EBX6_9PEZI|nr:hypothetical protein B0H67DRAFT_559482 [Lasiosphaeris hirsuta]
MFEVQYLSRLTNLHRRSSPSKVLDGHSGCSPTRCKQHPLSNRDHVRNQDCASD